MRAVLEAATGLVFSAAPSPLGAGGGFAACQRWESTVGPVFVKVAPLAREAALEAEAEALRELAAADAVRVPGVLGVGVSGDRAFVALEWIESGAARASTGAQLGEQLARLHRTSAARYGWHRDNTIGATPQVNTGSGDWIAFWRSRRLGFQLELAQSRGHGGRLIAVGKRLLEALPAFFRGRAPPPSLLHGDLWSGNAGQSPDGEPVIYDPAVYYGDREADLAMTELFGGFPRSFYDAYRAEFPLDAGYETRKHLYNLYHVLNHLNLFGRGYGAQAQRMIDQLLACV